MERAQPLLLILDACVLIDFCDVDVSVLGIISREVGMIHVALPVLTEVGHLDESSVESLGLQVIEPAVSVLARAAKKRGRLSFHDRLGLLLAKTNSWTCVSNDPALRSACASEGVAVLWGLEMMGLAVDRGHLSAAHAERVARGIREANPCITEAMLVAFLSKYARSSRRPGKR